jgi:hypothetical protein
MKITPMRNQTRIVVVSPGVNDDDDGTAQKQQHPASVDGVLFTAQHKAASHAETSGLLPMARKAGRRELGRHGC